MKHISETLPGFKNLKEYSEFMQELVEKSASGQEIARGMDKHDKSKTQKSDTFMSKVVKKNANGSATEKHYSQVDHKLNQLEDMEPEAPPPEPLQPGQQVKIGNKMVDSMALAPKTVEVNISGEKDKVETKPSIQKDPRNQLR